MDSIVKFDYIKYCLYTSIVQYATLGKSESLKRQNRSDCAYKISAPSHSNTYGLDSLFFHGEIKSTSYIPSLI